MTESRDQFDTEVEERLILYAQIDTTSSDASKTTPGHREPVYLLNLLVKELNEIGAEEGTRNG